MKKNVLNAITAIVLTVAGAGCGKQHKNITDNQFTVSATSITGFETRAPYNSYTPRITARPEGYTLGKDREIKEGLTVCSYEELDSAVITKKAWLQTFTTEVCVYRLNNISRQAKLIRLVITEPFVEVYYEDEPTYNKVQLLWWAEADPEYILSDLESSPNNKSIESGGVQYYYFNPSPQEPGDDSPLGEQWVQICWVRDDRYFDLRITAPKFSEDMLRYCDIEKVPLYVN